MCGMAGQSQKLMELLMLFFAFGATSVDAMECGAYKIYNGQIPAQTRAKIHRKCGAPYSTSENILYYEKNKKRYRLHFNANSQLASIAEERD